MELHQRLENHWLACMATAGGGARVTRTGGATVVANPTVSGMSFNFVMLRETGAGRLASLIELGGALLAGYQRLPALFLSPVAGDMAELGADLARLGWRRLLRQAVLVRELPGAPLPEPPVGISVEAITTERIPLWGETLVEAYEVAPGPGAELAGAWGALLRAPGEGSWARGYLAQINGEPAGTGLTWSQGEIAGLYCGAVLPALRRRGVHRATMLRRLDDARTTGCRLAMLQTEAGSPVESLCTEQLGFTLAYHRELWSPDSPFTVTEL